MIYVDDRTLEQKTTHVLVAATDSFMSGWGHAEGGKSYVAWACLPKHVSKVEDWVRSRSEMKRVRRVSKTWRPSAKHTHIYVVGDSHPAIDS